MTHAGARTAGQWLAFQLVHAKGLSCPGEYHDQRARFFDFVQSGQEFPDHFKAERVSFFGPIESDGRDSGFVGEFERVE